MSRERHSAGASGGSAAPGRRARAAGAARGRRRVPRAGARSSSASGSSTRRSARRPQLLRPRRLELRLVRQLPGRCSRPTRCSRRSRTTRSGSRSCPALVTAIGLIFAVLTERVRWSVGVQDRGLHADGDLAVRGGRHLAPHVREGPRRRARSTRRSRSSHDAFAAPGVLPTAQPSTPTLTRQRRRAASCCRRRVRAGRRPRCSGSPAIPPDDVPERRRAGGRAAAAAGRDHRHRLARLQAGRRQARASSSRGELGLPGVTVELRDSGGKRVASTTTTDDDGAFAFDDVEAGSYQRRDRRRRRSPRRSTGVSWLGPKLITPAVMIAYIWVWAASRWW